MKRTWVMAIVLIPVLTGCHAPRDGMTELTGSIAPLRDAFNARSGTPRFLTLLSPT